MRRSPHFSKHGTSLRRTRRRRMQLTSIRRAQHKRRLIYFMSEVGL